MKLRIRGNTLRLRLTRPEVDAVVEGGEAREAMALPGGAALTYVFARGEAGLPAATLVAGAAGAELRVTWPRAAVQAWAADNSAVSLRALLPLAGGEDALSLLVEKDFPCLVVREGEDDTPAFARPG
jgi:hypothetical protein